MSQDLPQGSLLCFYSVAPGYVLCGASTDRSDYYHQIEVTSSRACSNAVGPPVRLSKLTGTSAYTSLLKLGVSRLGSAENCRLGRSGKSAFNLKGGDPLVCGSFSSLFQGDHAGVEFATCGHENLLRDFHFLDPDSRFVAGRPPPLTEVADALVIDDYSSVCQLPARQRPPMLRPSSLVPITRTTGALCGSLFPVLRLTPRLTSLKTALC